MEQKSHGSGRAYLIWLPVMATLAAVTGCGTLQSTLDSLKAATEPTTSNTPLTLVYSSVAVVPDRSSKTDQTRGGVEISLSALPAEPPAVGYTIKVSRPTGIAGVAYAPPASSSDIVWNTFYHQVRQDPLFYVQGQAPTESGNPYQPFQVTLVPAFANNKAPLLQIVVTNHTSKTISAVIDPLVSIDGVQYDDPELLHLFGPHIALHRDLQHPITLTPGASDTWIYRFALGSVPYTRSGTIVARIPNILVDPINSRHESFQFAFDYTLKTLQQVEQQKSASLSLPKLVAQGLDAQPVQAPTNTAP